MTDVIVFGEGRTEEAFLRNVLGPPLADQGIYIRPRLIPTSPLGRGGALSAGRVLRHLRNTLRARADAYVATFFDLYALADDFPGVAAAKAVANPLERASKVEAALSEAVVRAAQCRPERFLPHIQPFEFESLLFADTNRLVELEPGWVDAAQLLRAARTAATSPEHINDGPETHPSARLKALLRPQFQKVLHGPAAAQRIGLDRIRRECEHFHNWLARVERLKPL
jgi:hypothetical protein